jgi:hypothetical protein
VIFAQRKKGREGKNFHKIIVERNFAESQPPKNGIVLEGVSWRAEPTDWVEAGVSIPNEWVVEESAISRQNCAEGNMTLDGYALRHVSSSYDCGGQHEAPGKEVQA